MDYRINEINDRNIDELIGISRGLLADNKVNKEEVEYLLNWIENHFNSDNLQKYPINTIYDRLVSVLADNILDEHEAQDIKELLQKFTGEKPILEEIASMSSLLPLCNPSPTIFFKDKVFCLTGAFTIGTRKTVENIIKELGGEIKKAPTLKTNYLIIGILGSEDWIHSSYGRKIELAVEIRDVKKKNINIITEEHFIRYL